ncbi:VRR-NUC domain-containing protein [Microbulbifer sp. ZKSA002]|uniref:VRR-NUC domain-containing protein n=1 Tax=Microbulbifer sp. ZKSA002 TaxID=3243388 RepID=UPI004039C1E7
MTQPIELPTGYYLDNFKALIEFVSQHYSWLITTSEQKFFKTFQELDIYSQRLYVRLLSRKGVPSSRGSLFRLEKLSYGEIESIESAAAVLDRAGLLCFNPVLTAQEYLPLFTKAELLAAGPSGIPKSLSRPSLEQLLLEDSSSSDWFVKLLSQHRVLAVQGAEHFQTFKLCYFGNLNQDLTDYVLRDLGLYRYESYPLDKQNLPFQSRAQIDQYLLYYQCLELLEEPLLEDAEAIIALSAQLPEGIDGDSTLARRLDRIRLKLARQLERLNALEQADALYQLCKTPPARERRARIAVKQGYDTLALEICEEIIAFPMDQAEREFALSFGYRTAKRSGGLNNWQAPHKIQAPTEVISLAQGESCVELLVAEHLKGSSGGECFYVENTLFTGVLGLYIWDILFAPVPGAFFNPFQVAPADFRTADFYYSRQALFTQRLAEIEHESLKSRVLATFAEKQGIANPLVTWEALSTELLEEALDRIPPSHWRSIFTRMLSDITQNKNGLPDLICFTPSGHYELVEVKGPGDRLQKNQQRWLAFFAEEAIPHRVIHVEWH